MDPKRKSNRTKDIIYETNIKAEICFISLKLIGWMCSLWLLNNLAEFALSAECLIATVALRHIMGSAEIDLIFWILSIHYSWNKVLEHPLMFMSERTHDNSSITNGLK